MPFDFIWSEFYIFEAPTPPSEVEITYLSGETMAEPVLPARSIQLSVNGADYPLQLVGQWRPVYRIAAGNVSPSTTAAQRATEIAHSGESNQPAFTYPVNPIEDKVREK